MTDATVAWITPEAVRAIGGETAEWFPKETGGVLVGYVADRAARQIVVTSVIGPGPAATHRRSRFEPDFEWQQQELERMYEACGRRRTYVGDWHSHPYGPAALSLRDRKTLLRIALHRAARAYRPLMLIPVALDGETPPRLSLFQLRGVKARVVTLHTASLPS
jgi:integrative and conjugative element protein (TIGR02256 family)